MPSAPTNFTKTELRAGFVVLLSGVIFLIFLLSTTALRPTDPKKTFLAYFSNTVGLNRGAEVRFGGVQVGTVANVEPSPENRALIRVEARVSADTPVNEASQAYISQVTLTSPKHLAISTGTADAALLDDGAVVPEGSGDLFTQLASAAGDVTELIDSVKRLMGTEDEQGNPLPAGEFGTVGELLLTLDGTVSDVQVILGVREPDPGTAATETDVTTVTEILENVDLAVQDGGALVGDIRSIVEENRATITEITTKVTEIADSAHELIAELNDVIASNRGNIDGAIEDVSHILDTAATTADKLAAQLDTLTATLQSTLENVEQLTGDAQALMQDSGPTIEEIILDVREITRDLKEFSRTLATEPQSVIRGKPVTGRQ